MSVKYWRGAIAVGLLVLAGDVTASSGRPATRPATPSEPAALVGELERLTEGLLFMSETDAPLTVVAWTHPVGRPTARRLASLVGEPHPELVEQTTVERFFRAALLSRPEQTAEDDIVVRRYTALVRFFKDRLGDVQVFRFGRTTIRSYVVGVSPSGDWIGLSTSETET